MPTAKPMLGEVELQLVQKIDTEGDQVLAQHGVPALEGDFFQGLGRRAERLTLDGVLTGPEAGEGLKTLREKFRAAEPISFVADIGTATKVDKVFIEEMGVRDLAGKPERFEYAFALREFLPPPPAQTEEPPPSSLVDEDVRDEAADRSSEQVDQLTNSVGTLEVQVDVGEGGDYSGIRVIVEGETSSGEPVSTFSEEQSDGLYRFTGIQAGIYAARLEIA
jgi:hypothetical protein